MSVAPRFVARAWTSLTPVERRSVLGMASAIIVLHLIGIGVLVGLVLPRHFALGGSTPVFSFGVGALAYTFGLRHAFDADHIAAVDNTTRKLLTDRAQGRTNRRPLAVGFWFALGHSTIVLALSVALALGLRALASPLEDDGSRLHTLTSLIGASVSGVFLWIIGLLNLAALIGLITVLRRLRSGTFDQAELEHHLNHRGLFNRLLGGLTRSISASWQIYPVGLLFGLGFDTATEVGLLVLAGGAAAFDLPFYAILVLPVLFAAGMVTMDTLDGLIMNGAYGWAFRAPIRTIFYNLIVTSLSVAVALIIGTIELIGVIVQRLGVTHGILADIAELRLDYVGYAIVVLFAVVWLASWLVWRYAKVEQRWGGRC